jgi:hypothetical protein
MVLAIEEWRYEYLSVTYRIEKSDLIKRKYTPLLTGTFFYIIDVRQ